MNELRTITAAPIRKTRHVKAPPERAFEVFAGAMGQWWPKEHSILQSPRKDVIVEPGAGGRWYEVAEDGTESQWGRVLAWEPPHRLLLAWQLNAEFTYDPDLETEVEVLFHPEAEGTRIEFEHRYLERFGPEGLARLAEMEMGMDEGWGQILDVYTALASAQG